MPPKRDGLRRLEAVNSAPYPPQRGPDRDAPGCDRSLAGKALHGSYSKDTRPRRNLDRGQLLRPTIARLPEAFAWHVLDPKRQPKGPGPAHKNETRSGRWSEDLRCSLFRWAKFLPEAGPQWSARFHFEWRKHQPGRDRIVPPKYECRSGHRSIGRGPERDSRSAERFLQRC